jgi:hypothetical protein
LDDTTRPVREYATIDVGDDENKRNGTGRSADHDDI